MYQVAQEVPLKGMLLRLLQLSCYLCSLVSLSLCTQLLTLLDDQPVNWSGGHSMVDGICNVVWLHMQVCDWPIRLKNMGQQGIRGKSTLST